LFCSVKNFLLRSINEKSLDPTVRHVHTEVKKPTTIPPFPPIDISQQIGLLHSFYTNRMGKNEMEEDDVRPKPLFAKLARTKSLLRLPNRKKK